MDIMEKKFCFMLSKAILEEYDNGDAFIHHKQTLIQITEFGKEVRQDIISIHDNS
jgi:hypothetical protein